MTIDQAPRVSSTRTAHEWSLPLSCL